MVMEAGHRFTRDAEDWAVGLGRYGEEDQFESCKETLWKCFEEARGGLGRCKMFALLHENSCHNLLAWWPGELDFET